MKKTTKEFKVIIERDEDGLYVASVPALPGCYTQAKTLEALQVRVREAISLCLEVAKTDKEYGRHIKHFAYEPSFVGLDTVGV